MRMIIVAVVAIIAAGLFTSESYAGCPDDRDMRAGYPAWYCR
jgi:hypothetical protein